MTKNQEPIPWNKMSAAQQQEIWNAHRQGKTIEYLSTKDSYIGRELWHTDVWFRPEAGANDLLCYRIAPDQEPRTENQEPVAKSVRLVCGSFGRCQRRVRIAPDQDPRTEGHLSISLSSEDMDALRELAQERDTSPEELAARWLSVNIQLMAD